MAGYSGTPLPRKLGIKEGHRIALVDPPEGFDLGTLPAGVAVSRWLSARGAAPPPLDVIVAFVTRRAELAERLAACRAHLAQSGGLWIAWPKRASGVATDVVEDAIREVALPTGLVDNKVCAIDDTWSGLRLVIRKELRAPAPKAAAKARPAPKAGPAPKARPAPKAKPAAKTRPKRRA